MTPKRKKRWNRYAIVREIARACVGQPKPSSPLKDRRRKLRDKAERAQIKEAKEPEGGTI